MRCGIGIKVLKRSYSANSNESENYCNLERPKQLRYTPVIILINNIFDTSVSHDQNFHQWQCSIIVMCLCMYNVGWYNVDTFVYQFFETGTSDRTHKGRNQFLKCLGSSLYPL